MTSAAIYARYSSDKQRESSIEDQERNCCGFAKREGWTIVARFADEALSGPTTCACWRPPSREASMCCWLTSCRGCRATTSR